MTALEKLLSTQEKLIPDDDHLDRKPILTTIQQEEAGKELFELLKKKFGLKDDYEEKDKK